VGYAVVEDENVTSLRTDLPLICVVAFIAVLTFLFWLLLVIEERGKKEKEKKRLFVFSLAVCLVLLFAPEIQRAHHQRQDHGESQHSPD
jgi:heme O synthase-like polyprenyltransferase